MANLCIILTLLFCTLCKLCEACSLMQLPHGHFGLRSGFLFCCCCPLLLLLLVMSVDPLRVLVRRLRAAASADDAQLSAAFAALPHNELLRVYYFCRDAVREARDTGLGYDTDGSSEFDLPGLESLAGLAQPLLLRLPLWTCWAWSRPWWTWIRCLLCLLLQQPRLPLLAVLPPLVRPPAVPAGQP